MTKRFLFMPLLWLGWSLPAIAQQGATAAGGDATGVGGSISYSVGQPFYQTAFGSDITLQAGVQQAYEISEVSSVWSLGGTVVVSAFPNPTSDYVRVLVEMENPVEWTCRVFDSAGRLVQTQQSSDSALLLPFQSLSAGTYLIEVRVSPTQFKTFQLVKTNL
jgi:hypothetical protein